MSTNLYNKVWGVPINDVFIQDQFTDRLSLFLGEVLDTITLLTDTTKDDTTIDIETTGYTPLVGDFICLQEDMKTTQVEIASVAAIAGNQYTITIHVPLDYSYTTLSGCSLLNVDMNVNGSVTPVDFRVKPVAGVEWDITRMNVGMVLGSAGDDGKFGNLAALTEGVFFRKEDSESSQNLFLAKDNSDFRLEGYDITYPIRSGGGGDFGMAARITFAGQDKSGVTVRLDGDTGDSFRATVNDDLLLIGKFRVKIQGHIVESR